MNDERQKVSDERWQENPDREWATPITSALAEAVERLCRRVERRERLQRENQIEVWRKVR